MAWLMTTILGGLKKPMNGGSPGELQIFSQNERLAFLYHHVSGTMLNFRGVYENSEMCMMILS